MISGSSWARPADVSRSESPAWRAIAASPSAPGWLAALDSELERAQRRTLAGIYSELQTLDHRADLLSQYTTFFDAPERAWSEAAAYQQVDIGAVRAFAATRLGAPNSAQLVVEPAGERA